MTPPPRQPADILLDLVAIPSVSFTANNRLIDYATGLLGSRDWDLRLIGEEDQLNLVGVTRGHDSTVAELALVCHTDTVPYDSDWAEAVHPVVREGRLYGRGSCDVKGYLACVLAAVGRVDLSRLTKPLGVVLTANEEAGCLGAKRLAREEAFRAKAILIGEPTNLTPITAGKGYGLAEIVVRGREAHSAFPDRGRSAIRDAARVIERLDHVAQQLCSRTHPAFDPPFTTLNIGLIAGGSAKNIVPGQCRLTVEWRPIPGQSCSWASDLIRDELDRLALDPGFQAELQVQRLDQPFESSGGRLISLLKSLSGEASRAVSFGTEAAHLAPLADEVIVFGPGDMAVAHKTGEFVPVGELDSCVDILVRLIEQLCR